MVRRHAFSSQSLLLAAFMVSAGSLLYAQQAQFNLLSGRAMPLIPETGVDGVRNAAINNGKIAAVAEKIAPERARRVVDAAGLYVTPGLN